MTGGTTISAVAVLTNPRPIDKTRGPRNLLFDVNIYVADDHDSPSLGLFRYFNKRNVTFEDEFTYAFIVVHVSEDPLERPILKLTLIF